MTKGIGIATSNNNKGIMSSKDARFASFRIQFMTRDSRLIGRPPGLKPRSLGRLVYFLNRTQGVKLGGGLPI